MLSLSHLIPIYSLYMQTVHPFEGILLIDKPKACTSHDVVDRVRRKLGMRQIGHAGTLDPMATGLLIILVGKATKVSQYLMSLEKTYQGTLKLGETTDSQDAEGKTLCTRPVPDISEEDFKAAMLGFMGDQYQTPPMFSAKKIDGVPLYKIARKGKVVERERQFIHVASFDLLGFHSPFADFNLVCSKGTYVRTLANDLGETIGCGAHLCALRRTATHSFQLSNALSLDTFESLSFTDIQAALIPTYQAVPSQLVR